MSDERADEVEGDEGSYSADFTDQLQPEDTLDQGYQVPGQDDFLDAGYSPPDRARGSEAWGVTPWEEEHEETIDQRILQEEPDPTSAYGRPENESGLDDDAMLGGDDPDAIPAEDDFVGDVGRRTGRLVAPDEGAHEDAEKDEVAEDVGIDGAAASAEEAAMHIAADDAGVDDFGTDDQGLGLEGLTESTAERIEGDDPQNELDSLASANDDAATEDLED